MRILVGTVLVRPPLFIEAANGFDVSIAAAITKKHVPIALTVLCAVAFAGVIIAAVLFLPAGWTSMKSWMWW
ncbi:MAG: hypothetical protein GZ088_06915 [Acidipila sp.]|nr:hypothetical protein [Acidipila sp.]